MYSLYILYIFLLAAHKIEIDNYFLQKMSIEVLLKITTICVKESETVILRYKQRTCVFYATRVDTPAGYQ